MQNVRELISYLEIDEKRQTPIGGPEIKELKDELEVASRER